MLNSMGLVCDYMGWNFHVNENDESGELVVSVGYPEKKKQTTFQLVLSLWGFIVVPLTFLSGALPLTLLFLVLSFFHLDLSHLSNLFQNIFGDLGISNYLQADMGFPLISNLSTRDHNSIKEDRVHLQVANLIRNRPLSLGIGVATVRIGKLNQKEDFEEDIRILRGWEEHGPKVLVVQDGEKAKSYARKYPDISFVTNDQEGITNLHAILEDHPISKMMVLVDSQGKDDLEGSSIIDYLTTLESENDLPILSYLTFGVFPYLLGRLFNLNRLEEAPKPNWKRFRLMARQA
ncbi:hypothetical protein BVX98_05585 [bacterium F11]|nr:hypothetical protein BVX98_05585 [bacterium F11]